MRLIVKTVTDPKVDGCLYRVDVSKGLKHFLRRLSRSDDVGFTVQSLKLITTKDGGVVVTTPIKSLQALDELDIVLAVGDAVPIAVSTPERARPSARAASSAVVTPLNAAPSSATKTRDGVPGRTTRNGKTESYSVGTKVRKLWFAQGWFDGVVTSINRQLKCYHIKYDDGDEEDVEFGDGMDEIVRRAREKDIVVPPLSDEQRSELQGIGIDLEDFGDFLYYELGLTHENARSVYHPVVRLRSGEGVTYPDWPKGIVFHPYVVDDMGEDFIELLEEAKRDEELFGEDENKNRKLLIPLERLIQYQKHYYYQKFPQNAMNVEDQSETENLGQTAVKRGQRHPNAAKVQPSRKRRATPNSSGVASTHRKKHRGIPLSTEQRFELSGTAIDINHLENYVSEVEQFANTTILGYLAVATGLINGTGFTDKCWNSRASFHAQPIYLDEDFGMLYEEAVQHERRHGKVPGSRLRSTIRMLERYQQHYYYEMLLDDQCEVAMPLERATTSKQDRSDDQDSNDPLQNEGVSARETDITPSPNRSPVAEAIPQPVLVMSQEPTTGQSNCEATNSASQQAPVAEEVTS